MSEITNPVEALFLRALEVPLAEREAFLTQQCGDDADLLAQAQELLAAHEQTGSFVVDRHAGFAETSTSTRIELGEAIGPYKLLQEIGCFAIVLEKIPAQLAKVVSEALDIPTIGIGGGMYADGQVLVTHDMLGITRDFQPRFLRRYMELFDAIKLAVEQYCTDVKSGDFPNEHEQY